MIPDNINELFNFLFLNKQLVACPLFVCFMRPSMVNHPRPNGVKISFIN